MEDIIVKDKSGTITVDNPTFTDEEIISEIKLNKMGDFVTFELILKNNELEKFKINSITDNNINDNIEIEYDYDDDYILKNDTTKVKCSLR